MKKNFLWGAMLITLFASCNQSPEDKAKALIKEDIEKVLYHPETYDPAETQIDSAFTPFDDPIFYEKTVQLYQLGIAIDEHNEKMKDAKSSMSLWGGSHLSAFSRNEYQEAKKEYDENAEKKKKAEIKAKKLGEELKTMLEQEQEFIGFKVQHSYRSNNNAGQTVFGEMEYLFDKDMSKIIASYNMDGYEYKVVQIVYKQMLGEEEVLTEDE